MIRLHFVVEGQTEEEFVNSVLRDYLAARQIVSDARGVLTSRQGYRQFKGGVSKYSQVRRDLQLWMMEDYAADARFTTMVDLYRLPSDFPAKAQLAAVRDPHRRVEQLEESFDRDIADRRFIPYLQLHEFETLLFTDIRCLLSEFPAAGEQVERLRRETAHFASPELVDDGPETAPSKRIIAEIPAYRGLKVSAGPRLANSLGLPLIREKCRHFDAWLTRLEELTGT